MALSSAATCRAKARGCRSQQRSAPRPFSTFVIVATIATLAFLARSADCQEEKRLSQQQQYYESDDGGAEVIKSKIRLDTYSGQVEPSHSKHQSADSVGSASTVYGEQYVVGNGGLVQDHTLLDEEAQESISSGAINNHRIPQYTRGAGAPDVVEGKNVGNRAVNNNNYHHQGTGNPSAITAAGYAVDSAAAYGPHYSSQDLIQDQNYQLEYKYHDYDKMTKFLRTTSSRFPNLTALYSIGKSVQGKSDVSSRIPDHKIIHLNKHMIYHCNRNLMSKI